MSNKITKDKSSLIIILLGSLISIGLIAASVYATSIGSVITTAGLTVSGNSTLATTTISERLGIGTTTPRTKLELDNDGAILAIGTYGSGWTEPNLGAGTRLMWYPRKAAFRAGGVDGTQWNDANIGDYSVAMGASNIASGVLSTVGGGLGNIASGICSIIGGGGINTASNSYSTIGGGNSNTASSYYSIVGGGYSNTASGLYSTVGGGDSNTASNSYSTIGGGNSNTASNDGSTVGGGRNNIASGLVSTVSGGYYNTAAGDYSWAGGRYMQLSASADRTFVWGYSDSAFSIDTPNAFLIDPNGYGYKVGIGTSTPQATLDVQETASSTIKIGDTSKTGCIELGGNGGTKLYYIYVDEATNNLVTTTTKPAICE